MHFLKRAWRGEEKLDKVFWVYGFLYPGTAAIILALIILFLINAGLLKNTTSLRFAWWTVLFGTIIEIFLTIPYTIWWNISVWKCSSNSSSKVWKFTARAFTICMWCYMLTMVLSVVDGIIILKANTMEPLATALCKHDMEKTASHMFLNSKDYIKDNLPSLRQCVQSKLIES